MFVVIFTYLVALLLFLNGGVAWSVQPVLAAGDVILAIWFTVAGSVQGWQTFKE